MCLVVRIYFCIAEDVVRNRGSCTWCVTVGTSYESHRDYDMHVLILAKAMPTRMEPLKAFELLRICFQTTLNQFLS